MANPYHDEHGKFCKKEEMLGAIARLHQDGNTDAAMKLFFEYKAVEEEGMKPSPPAGYETTSPVAPQADEDHPEAGSGAAEAERKRQEVTHVINLYGLTIGNSNRRNLRDVDEAFSDYWRGLQHDLHIHPDENLMEEVIDGRDPVPFYTFTTKTGKDRILFAYNRRLYVTDKPLEDQWGGYKFSDVDIADPEPVMMEPYETTQYVPAGTSGGKVSAAWLKRHLAPVWARSQASLTDRVRVVGLEQVETKEEEVAYGKYQQTTIWRDPKNGSLYRHIERWDSWDNGENDMHNSFQKVEAKKHLVHLDPHF